MKRSLRLVFLLTLLLAWGAPAGAKPAKVVAAPPTACGYKTIPLATGNSWTYKANTAQVTLKITNVSQGKDWSGKPATVIDVDETYNGKTQKTTWTCTPKEGLLVGLESFLWSGEPGGFINVQLNVTSHDKPWLVSEAELTGDVSWTEVIKATAVRTDGSDAGAQHPEATLDLTRVAQLKGTEVVFVIAGQFNTEKVAYELRGKATVQDQALDVPIKRPATIWFSKGVGVVKIDDAFDKTWELTESNLVPPAPPAPAPKVK